MAGVMNNTARQFNVKAICKKNKTRVVVRIAPGFNVVEDAHWNVCKQCNFVKELKKDGHIDFGTKVDDLELEQDPSTKSKSKAEPMPKTRASVESEAEK